ncbi:MAG TPA: orotate phosphoribosyltransferase [Thermococcus sp.]|nr:MAG: orotate phosphoribosyltransferase [Thermoplasmata archaeon]RLF40127.1 MAG: orotate phosphoribosyltransferase [Thermoplasmata archaeon]HDH45252.1 orotate phosphoribosyltransferase [Thermococcus sp.]
MELIGLCSICGRAGARYTCRLCGRIVCEKCFDFQNGICINCRSSKHI